MKKSGRVKAPQLAQICDCTVQLNCLVQVIRVPFGGADMRFWSCVSMCQKKGMSRFRVREET